MCKRCLCLLSDDVNLHPEEAIAETCGFELLDKPHMAGRLHEVTDTEHVSEPV